MTEYELSYEHKQYIPMSVARHGIADEWTFLLDGIKPRRDLNLTSRCFRMAYLTQPSLPIVVTYDDTYNRKFGVCTMEPIPVHCTFTYDNLKESEKLNEEYNRFLYEEIDPLLADEDLITPTQEDFDTLYEQFVVDESNSNFVHIDDFNIYWDIEINNLIYYRITNFQTKTFYDTWAAWHKRRVYSQMTNTDHLFKLEEQFRDLPIVILPFGAHHIPRYN